MSRRDVRYPLSMLAFGAAFAGVGCFALVVGVTAINPIGVLFGLVFLAVGTLAMLSGVAHIRVSRQLGKWAVTRPSRIIGQTASGRVPAAVPPGPLTVIEHRTAVRVRPPSSPRSVSTLYLRVFETNWGALLVRLTRIGPVYLLLGGDSVASDLGRSSRMAFGKVHRFVEETEAEVLQRLATFRGRRQHFGYYPRYQMICTDDIWTFALDRLLERVNIIVVDLTGYTPGSAGLEYEFAAVLDRIPLGQVIFVIGPETERAAFDATMKQLWTTLPETSVNYSAGETKMHLAVTTALGERSISRTKSQGMAAIEEGELGMIVGLIGDAVLRISPQQFAPPRPLPPPQPHS